MVVLVPILLNLHICYVQENSNAIIILLCMLKKYKSIACNLEFKLIKRNHSYSLIQLLNEFVF